MKIRPVLGLIAALALPASLPVYAQSSSSRPGEPEGMAAARDALKQKEGDTDQTTLLQQTLTAVDKQYSLLKRGKVAVTYDFNYSYIGQEKINADLSSGQLTLFNIENDSSHTITNTLAADYGVLDNLTASFSVPLVSKYSQNPTFDGTSHSIGDIALGARYQPFETRRGQPSMTFNGSLRLPTGRSPFKVQADQGLATGSGSAALTAGINVNHIVDPVALFGSLSFTYSAPASHLSQVRGNRILARVEPGMSIGFGIGFAYALSYNISTSLSLQETISAGSKLRFADGTEVKTQTQTAGVLTFGLGYRVSPKTTINITAGVGLTPDAPNFSIGVNLPIDF
ncbi:transporter [Oxalobacteraceae bacterium OM1]|nr:transporter [Oxalobacteraceae bacterium OM1]